MTWAKAVGDKLSYASTGNSSASNLAVLAQIRPGKLRALAVSSLKRNANLPDVSSVDEIIVKAGFDMTPSNPAELGEFVKMEIVKWAKVVKDSGAGAE